MKADPVLGRLLGTHYSLMPGRCQYRKCFLFLPMGIRLEQFALPSSDL